MTFDGFYTQLQAGRDLSGSMAFCHHPQHLELSRRELVERATQLDGFGDRGGETREILLQYQVLGAGPDAGYGRFATDAAGHEDERDGGPDAVKQCQCGLSGARTA